MAYAPTQKPIIVKSNSAIDSQTCRAPVMHRHRKTVSTGGGRAWSDAEEAYLIETREHKMPYKHIASQLKKTELACRLHYHQLSFGSKARRHSHAPTNPYDRSSAPPPPTRSRGKTTPQRALPSFSSPPTSPPDETTTDYNSPSETSTPQSHHNKPILPKPTVSSSTTKNSTATTTTTTQNRSPNDTHHSPLLRLVTQDVDRPPERQHSYVDMARLDAIYDAHRLHFWSTIARTYGRNLSPATLEEAWLRCAHGHHPASSGCCSRFPPTPRGSPHDQSSCSSSCNKMLRSSSGGGAETTDSGGKGGSERRGFTPINNSSSSSSNNNNSNQSSNNNDNNNNNTHNHNNNITTKATTAAPRHNSSFAISSLLTEDRDVRSPREKKAAEEDIVDIEMKSAG